MKTFLLLLLALGCVVEMNAQNLVPNSSFEDHTYCPTSVAQVYYCIGWKSVLESPDYFDSCSTTPLASVPNNGFGSQDAHTGSAYCGFGTYEAAVANYREIIEVNLTSALIVGESYLISFYVCLGNSVTEHNHLASNKIGARLSTNDLLFSYSYLSFINNFAHFYTDSIITDSLNWVHLQKVFIADSAYQFISFGNFFDDAHTDTMHMGSLNEYSYYYIDDVSVTKSTGEGIQHLNPPTFTLSPNPTTTLLTINNPSGIKHLTLANSIGQIVFASSDVASAKSDKVTIDVSTFPAGVYFVQLKDEREVWVKEVVVQH